MSGRKRPGDPLNPRHFVDVGLDGIKRLNEVSDLIHDEMDEKTVSYDQLLPAIWKFWQRNKHDHESLADVTSSDDQAVEKIALLMLWSTGDFEQKRTSKPLTISQAARMADDAAQLWMSRETRRR